MYKVSFIRGVLCLQYYALGSKGQHQSPVRRKNSNYQNSPAKRQLDFSGDKGDTPASMDVDHVPLSSPKQIKDGPSRTTIDEGDERRLQLDVADPSAIMDDLAKSSKVRQRTSDVTQPLSSTLEPSNRTSSRSEVEVPRKLVPSKSTERIMDILLERGLGIGQVQSSTKKKRPGLSESLAVVEEDSYSSDSDEDSQYPKDLITSSTPAAPTKSDESLHQCHQQLNGLLSPSHMFSVGSSPSPVHGTGQEFNMRSSRNSLVSLPEGTFLGKARHKDESLMSIVFQVNNNC